MNSLKKGATWHIDPLLGNARETKKRQWPLLGSSLHATVEIVLEDVFSMWSTPRLYHANDRVQLSSVSAVQWSELVGECVSL
jgi:hypothetical protein